jgi:tetratricopeptide (TPR) repeat protein
MGLFGELERRITSDDKGGSISLRQDSAEFHFFMARAELRSGENLSHGFSHLAELLFYDPGNPDFLAIGDAYLERADAATLLPETDNRYFATEALRAYLWARDGRLDEAAQLWCAVHRAKSDSRYLQTWGVQALEPAGAIESLSVDTGLELLGRVLVSLAEQRYQTARERETSARYGKLAQRFADSHPGRPELAMIVPGLLRKAGLFDDALAWVRRGGEPTWHSAVAEGLILREAGRTAEADAAFELALRCDPDDVSARLEAGDMYARLQRWDEALRWYERALQADPQHSWALPSARWCRSKLAGEIYGDGPTPLLDEVIALANAGNGRASGLLDELREYTGYLPEPTDATANGLRQMLAKGSQLTSITIATTAVEAPSNQVAYAVASGYADDFDLSVSSTSVATPDPRRPAAEIRYPVWRLEGEVLRPALPRPPTEVAEAIAAVARLPYDRDVAWAAASLVPRDCPHATAETLLACIVWPPLPPAGTPALAWISRVHLAVSDALAQLGDGWDDTPRRDALLSLLHGPMDWSTGTTALSLARLARDEPALCLEIHRAFEILEAARPDSGPVCWETPLYWAWCRMSHLHDKEHEELLGKLRASRS